MPGSQNFTVKLTIAMAICTVALATLYFTTPVAARNQIATFGEIQVCNENGKSELTSINFPLFTPAKPATQLEWFVVRNTGKQTVHVCWSLTASSIAWSLFTRRHSNGYDHKEGGIQKYSFRILQDTRKPNAYIPPEQKTILLKSGENKRLCFELSYSGKPSTAETFTLTVSFYATKA